MSKKSRKLNRLAMIMSAAFAISLCSCDPCRELAEKECDCLKDDAEKRRQCRNELNLASSYKFFKTAKEPKNCEKALKLCTCEELLKGNYKHCSKNRESTED